MKYSLRALLPRRWRRDVTTIPVVRLSGTIGSGGRFQSGLTLAGVENGLKKAFAMGKAPVVAIVISSPGGAPVQSHLIYKRIRALAAEKEKQVIVAVDDVAASGGYLIALAGDQIIVDDSSIVGSIGVVSAGFGFTGLLERLGVERRVHTAGSNKGMLDPFQPEKEDDVARLRAIQDDVHGMFSDLVRERRGKALKDDPDMFSGAFWAGRRAVELGLADQVGDLHAVLRERFGDKVRLRPITVERTKLMQRLGMTLGPAGGQIAGQTLAMIEERALWSRFGL
jgi:serine protease SohB